MQLPMLLEPADTVQLVDRHLDPAGVAIYKAHNAGLSGVEEVQREVSQRVQRV